MTTTPTLLRRFLGTWQGRGDGRFPTIEPFQYVETLRFAARDGVAALHYEQVTSQVDGEPSHWESGFLIPQEDGAVHLLNAQESGRTEVLVGGFDEVGEELVLTLESVSHAHDPRMRSSTRTYRLAGDALRYEVQMATDRVAALERHLACELMRAPRGGGSGRR